MRTDRKSNCMEVPQPRNYRRNIHPDREEGLKWALGREDSQQGSGWWTGRDGGLQTGQSHIHVQINQEEQLGSENHHTTQSFSVGK